jgi:hypothetical protein
MEKDRSCAIPLHQRLRALKSLNNGSSASTAHTIFGSTAPNDPWATALVQEQEVGGAADHSHNKSREEQPPVAPAPIADDAAPSAGARA